MEKTLNRVIILEDDGIMPLQSQINEEIDYIIENNGTILDVKVNYTENNKNIDYPFYAVISYIDDDIDM